VIQLDSKKERAQCARCNHCRLRREQFPLILEEGIQILGYYVEGARTMDIELELIKIVCQNVRDLGRGRNVPARVNCPCDYGAQLVNSQYQQWRP
jgi:hypothetical protein